MTSTGTEKEKENCDLLKLLTTVHQIKLIQPANNITIQQQNCSVALISSKINYSSFNAVILFQKSKLRCM